VSKTCPRYPFFPLALLRFFRSRFLARPPRQAFFEKPPLSFPYTFSCVPLLNVLKERTFPPKAYPPSHDSRLDLLKRCFLDGNLSRRLQLGLRFPCVAAFTHLEKTSHLPRTVRDGYAVLTQRCSGAACRISKDTRLGGAFFR